MVLRAVIVEVLTPDEICWELYGIAKDGLIAELQAEGRSIRGRHARSRRRDRKPIFVPGPTLEALVRPECRKYLERGSRHDDS